MKKLITSLGALTLASFILFSCGGTNNNKEKATLPDPPTDLKYESVALIDGPLSEYIEVVPGNYFFELQESKYINNYDGTMKVKFKFIKPIKVKSGTGYNHYGPSLKGKALDDQGVPLDFSLSISADKDLATYLNRGSGEEWLILRLSGQGLIDDQADAEKLIKKFKKGKKIRFNSEIIEEKFASGTSSSQSSEEESEEETSSSSYSGDCDRFLKNYEKFITDYIAILKKYKANPTDMSIMSDYTEMVSEATKWADFNEDCANDPSFIGKYTELQMKIANAAAGL